MADTNKDNGVVIKITADISDFQNKINSVVSKLSETDAKVEKYKKQIQSIGKSKIPGMGQFKSDMQGLIKTYEQQSKSIKVIKDGMDSFQSAIGRLNAKYAEQQSEATKTQGVLDGLKRQYDELQRSIEGKQAKPSMFMKHSKEAKAAAVAVQEQNNAIIYAQAQIDKLTQEYNKLSDAEKAGTKGRGIAAQIEQQNKAIEEAQQKLPELKKRYEELSGAVTAERGTLSAQKAALAIKTQMDEVAGTLANQKEAMKETEAELASLSERYIATGHGALSLVRDMNQTGEQMDAISSSIGKALKAEELNAKLKSIGNTLSNIGKKIGGAVLSNIRKLGSGLASVAKNAVETVKAHNILAVTSDRLGKIFNRLGSTFSRMLMRMLARAVFQNIGNAMKALALQFSSFNDAMNSMGASANQLTGQIVAAFSPLIESIAPIINQLIGMIVNLMNAVSQLFAILGGQSTWRRAIKGAYDYSGAMSAAAGSASSAKDAQEEYNRTLFSFDEIHKLNEQNDKSSSGSGGGGGGSGSGDESAFQYVEEDLPKNKFTEWADKLAGAFKAHDWKTLGSTVADGVNAAFSWVDNQIKWENAGTKITTITSGIADTLNSFLSKTNWESVGKTVGDGLETILKTAISLQTKIDWKELGKSIASSINGLFTGLNLSTAATAFTNKINNIFDALSGFNTKIDWTALSTNITNGLSTLFTNFDWSGNAKAISDFVTGMVGAIGDVISKTDWKALGTGIAKALEKLDWKSLLEGVGKIIIGVITGIFDIFGGLVDELTLSPALKELRDSSTEVKKIVSDLDDSLQQHKQGYETQKAGLDALIEKIDALSVAGDIDGAREAIALLLQQYPELEKYINDTGDGFNTLASEVSAAGDALIRYSQIEVIKEDYEKVLANQEQAYQSLITAQNESAAAEENYNLVRDSAGKKIEQLVASGLDYNTAQMLVNNELETAKDRLDDANTALETAKSDYRATENQANAYRTEIYKLDETTTDLTDKQDKNSDATENNKKKQIDLQTVLNKSKDYLQKVTNGVKTYSGHMKSAGSTTKTETDKMSLGFNGVSSTISTHFHTAMSKVPLVVKDAFSNSNKELETSGGQINKTTAEIAKTITDNMTIDLFGKGEKAGNTWLSGFTGEKMPETTGAEADEVDSNLTLDETEHGKQTGSTYKSGFSGQKISEHVFGFINKIKDHFAGIDETESGKKTGSTFNTGINGQKIADNVHAAINKINAFFKDTDETANGKQAGSTFNAGLNGQKIADNANTNIKKLLSFFGINLDANGKKAGSSFNTGLNGQKLPDNASATAGKILKAMGVDLTEKGKSAGKTFINGFGTLDAKSITDKIKQALGLDLTKTGKDAGTSYGTGISQTITSGIDTASIKRDLNYKLDFDLSSAGKSAGESFGSALKTAITSTYIPTPHLVNTGTNRIWVNGNEVKTPNFINEWYANGGLPDAGQIFIANEEYQNPELVGTIGHRAAVANSSQIVEGITSGVARGVAEAMALNGGRGQQQSGDIVIRIGNEEIFRMAKNGEKKYTKRTSPVRAI